MVDGLHLEELLQYLQENNNCACAFIGSYFVQFLGLCIEF